MLAVCSGALRTHLSRYDHDVDNPLVAIVPVSVREDGTEDAGGNSLSAMFVPLSNDKQTPLERLRTVKAAAGRASARSAPSATAPWPPCSPRRCRRPWSRPMVQFGVRAGLVRKLRAGNLMISNVPGPDFPLYFAGMRMEAVYPMGPVMDGVALNITVQSYEDSLYVGINSGAAALPDLPGLARAMVDELGLLSLMARGTAGVARHHRPSPSGAVATPRATGRPRLPRRRTRFRPPRPEPRPA